MQPPPLFPLKTFASAAFVILKLHCVRKRLEGQLWGSTAAVDLQATDVFDRLSVQGSDGLQDLRGGGRDVLRTEWKNLPIHSTSSSASRRLH
ncbi:hypothetical protein J6590_044464 [Homalodisca vitripennis]|nr:hypothetical protein J6590_044464 [Homalodisca vitripennis]